MFVDGFTEPAAAFVCAIEAEEAEGAVVADLLASLLDKSLLKTLSDQTSSNPDDARYGMLETIREYAQERMKEAGEEAVVRGRHADFFCRLAVRAGRGSAR